MLFNSSLPKYARNLNITKKHHTFVQKPEIQAVSIVSVVTDTVQQKYNIASSLRTFMMNVKRLAAKLTH